MKILGRLLMAAVLVMLPFSALMADVVAWTDLTSVSGNEVTGTLLGTVTVTVNSTGGYSFVQTSGGTNYWNPATPYVSTLVDNAPPASDIIALSTGGTVTIAFSQAVTDPLLALVSWNSNTVDFGVPINILSFGAGYWGNGTPILNSTGTGFFGSGEVHGVIRLPGDYSSITFTHTSEGWHGFTVGAIDIATAPLPTSILLLSSGFMALLGLRNFKRS